MVRWQKQMQTGAIHLQLLSLRSQFGDSCLQCFEFVDIVNVRFSLHSCQSKSIHHIYNRNEFGKATNPFMKNFVVEELQ